MRGVFLFFLSHMKQIFLSLCLSLIFLALFYYNITFIIQHIEITQCDLQAVCHHVVFFKIIYVYDVFGIYPIKPKPTHVKRCI
jgi:hypothetical protein